MLSRRLLRIKALKALYAHLQNESDNMIASEKSMLGSIDKAYDLYFQMLLLPVEVARYAEARQELAKEKKLPTYEDLNPNRKFVDNTVIRLIENSDSVNDYAARRKLNWSQDTELIKSIYNSLITSESYKSYMTSQESSLKEDIAFIENFFIKEMQECEALDEALEDLSIMWDNDLSYILPLIARTLSSIRPSHTELKIMPKYKSDEELDFVRTLFQKSLINYNQNQAYIEKFTSNWDLERIVFMDNLIMNMAMTELVSLPSVPIKVTMDEYIEISKAYSTPGSSTFINGVLDRVVNDLTAEGRINKIGRGLI
ncbi:MAG: transcription antitermination protein NusB [Rikenellaceae bacterium]